MSTRACQWISGGERRQPCVTGSLARLAKLAGVASLASLAILTLTSCNDRPSEPPPAQQAQAGSAAKSAPQPTTGATAPSQSPAADSAARLVQAPPAVKARLRTEPATTRAIAELITAPGEVALDLRQVAKIASRIEGQIDTIHVQLGGRVAKGQALAGIVSLQFDQLIEEYLVGKAQADVAQSSFARTQKLRADDIVSERKLIEERGRYLETSARFQHIREKLLGMGLTAAELKGLEGGRHMEGHRYTLATPIAGTVVAQYAVRGQGVAAGQEVFEVVDTSRVWVFANLPIEQARRFHEGDLGTITAKGAAPMTAPLTYLAPVADETTRTIQVRFEVNNPQGALKPREYVDVGLTVTSAPTVAVPLSAVTTIDGQRGLFIEQEGGYRFAPIETGREGDGLVAISTGVRDGDRILVDGVFDLKNVLLKAHIGSGD